MPNALQPFHLLVIALGGWLNRQQQAVIDYVMEGTVCRILQIFERTAWDMK